MSVEWSFGDIVVDLAFIDFKKNLKIGLQPVAMYYRVAALLTNCHTIINGGNKTSKYFGIAPPLLHEYLQ